MSKAKIEPMPLKRLKELIEFWHGNDFHHEDFEMALAWIHAEARAKHAYHHWNAALKVDHSEHFPCTTCDMKYEDWLAAVKKEVGWPED